MWLLTVEDEEGSSTYQRLSRDRYTVGRATDNDVVLAQLDISRRHARFEREGERWLIIDEGSRTLTYVNGCEIREPTPVGVGDVVHLGAYRLTLSDAHLTGVLTPPPRAMMPARLRVIAGLSSGTEYVFRRNDFVTIGADDGCSLRILHEAVGGLHAVIRALPGGLYELRSESGPVFVNGHLVRGSRLLEGGDAINVGGVALVRYLEPSQVPDPRFDRVLGEHVPLPVLDDGARRSSLPPMVPLAMVSSGGGDADAAGVEHGEALAADEALSVSLHRGVMARGASIDPETGAQRFEAIGPVSLPAPRVAPASYRILRETTMPAKRAREDSHAEVPLGLEATAPHALGWRQGAVVHFNGLPVDQEVDQTDEGEIAGRSASLSGAPTLGLAPTARETSDAPTGAEAASPSSGLVEGADRGQAGGDAAEAPPKARRRRTFGVGAALGSAVAAAAALLWLAMSSSADERGGSLPPQASSVAVGTTAAQRAGMPEGGRLAVEATPAQRPPDSTQAASTKVREAVALKGAPSPEGPKARSRPEGSERGRLEARARSGRASRAELGRLLSLCQLDGDARCIALAHEQTQRAKADR